MMLRPRWNKVYRFDQDGPDGICFHLNITKITVEQVAHIVLHKGQSSHNLLLR